VAEPDPASPLVSVVIPSFNRRVEAVQAVANVLQQEQAGLEVIVVDDGSSDGTVEALEAAYGADPRVRVLRQPNAGCGPARNTGIDAARAPYVALLDSDDRCLPGRLARQRDALERHPDVGMCVCDCWELRAGGKRVRMRDHHAFRWPTSLEAMFHGAWAVPSGWMMRTELARRIRFDARVRFQEDIDYLFQWHEAGAGVVVLEEPLLEYEAGAGATPSKPDVVPVRMSEQRARMADYGLWVYKIHWARLPPEQRRRIGTPTRILRLLTRHCEQTGRHRRARQHLLAWWRQRLYRLPLLVRYLRNLKPDRPDLSSSPLGDLDLPS
jgi:glycosyltransferase involved in cell wall biosynthesis